jgi:hypothetical protein
MSGIFQNIDTLGGGDTLAGEGVGVNISEKARHSSVLYIHACKYFVGLSVPGKMRSRCANSEDSIYGFRNCMPLLVMPGQIFRHCSNRRRGEAGWVEGSTGIFKQSMGGRNRVGIGLSYRPARLHSLAELVPWNRFLGSL